MITCCITYHFDPGLPIKDKIENYQNVGLKLFYDDSKLIKIEHYLCDDEQSTHDGVIQKSVRELGLFWEILEYRYGIPVRAKKITTKKMDENRNQTSSATISLGAILVKTIILPNESWTTSPDHRLGAWLKFANNARNASDHGEAIRTYYIILEDLKGRPKTETHSAAEIELKYARDFVSHGEKLSHPDLLAFLKEKIGYDVTQYNPNDPDHLSFVRQQRENARKIIEHELNKRI
ncbi:MAG: hypothetical protein Q7J27_14730 [Syntrophales bacterium]|nr:hypothetical protein [Syntrophales bacterium]